MRQLINDFKEEENLEVFSENLLLGIF